MKIQPFTGQRILTLVERLFGCEDQRHGRGASVGRQRVTPLDVAGSADRRPNLLRRRSDDLRVQPKRQPIGFAAHHSHAETGGVADAAHQGVRPQRLTIGGSPQDELGNSVPTHRLAGAHPPRRELPDSLGDGAADVVRLSRKQRLRGTVAPQLGGGHVRGEQCLDAGGSRGNAQEKL